MNTPNEETVRSVHVIETERIPKPFSHRLGWLRGLTVGVVTLASSILSAYAHLLYQGLTYRQWLLNSGMEPEFVSHMGLLRKTGDLPGFAVWSIGFAVLVTALASAANKIVGGHRFRYFVLGVFGVPFAAIVWVYIVASMLGPWMGAFSFPVFPCWLVAGFAGTVSPLCFRIQPK